MKTSTVGKKESTKMFWKQVSAISKAVGKIPKNQVVNVGSKYIPSVNEISNATIEQLSRLP